MITAARSDDARAMEEAVSEIDVAAFEEHAHARLGFLHGMGMMGERNKYKALQFHHFAANGGNMLSKMALAYTYKRHVVSEP